MGFNKVKAGWGLASGELVWEPTIMAGQLTQIEV